jgi:hypothetical protein
MLTVPDSFVHEVPQSPWYSGPPTASNVPATVVCVPARSAANVEIPIAPSATTESRPTTSHLDRTPRRYAHFPAFDTAPGAWHDLRVTDDTSVPEVADRTTRCRPHPVSPPR